MKINKTKQLDFRIFNVQNQCMPRCTLDCKKLKLNTLMILAGGGELSGQLLCHYQPRAYLEVRYGSGSLERMAQRMVQ